MNPSLATTIISLILLVQASQSSGQQDVKVLSYNPTYEFWFFMPTGRPSSVSPSVEAAYWEARGNGGVCYTSHWYYCKSGIKIE